MTINVLGGGFNPAAPVFPVQRSVRLRSSASAYFNRTPATQTSLTTWTWSGWVKRGALGNAALFTAGSSSQPYTTIQFQSDQIVLDAINAGSVVVGRRYSTAVFRDPSAWYHVVAVWDTTNSTASNRIRLYVNGVQLTSFALSSDPALNATTQVNATVNHQIGQFLSAGGLFDGYLTEVNFIDGQALTPSSFGSINSTTGVWQPIKYSGTYGTNGFYLNFNDNSAATAAAIGKDSSGNGNNWTPNNISVTAGVTYDSMLDVPTLTSATNANFATLNPLITSALISNANLTTSSNGSMSGVCGTMSLLSGKYYFELSPTSIGTSSHYGIIQQSPSAAQLSTSANSESVAYRNDGNIYRNTGGGFVLNQTVASFTTTDLMAAAVDTINLTVQFYKNNTAVGTPVSLTSGVEYTSWIVFGSTACVTSINFGQRPFTYTPPSGFKSLNTYNLPAPTIPNGATQFAATAYTGTGSAMTVTNTLNSVSFQPNFLWIKQRNNTANHVLADSIRGIDKYIFSNLTNQEATATAGTGITAFNSNGFSLGTETSTVGSVNAAGGTGTYIAWQWKAGSSTVTNTSGSISSQVSANPSAGFSIVTYTGNETSGATVGHGLGVAPKMIIIKSRSTAQNWPVYHVSTGNTGACLLNLTNAFTTAAGDWNNTSPTSTVITLGGGAQADRFNTNKSGDNYVAYCFSEIAGYSKFGSYTGNGSTDGPFIYTGFRPKFIMWKRTDTTGSWYLYDTSRSVYNASVSELYPNLSNAEGTSTTGIDILSNGWKIRTSGVSDPQVNASGGTYIFMAVAESPFNYSLAR